MKNLLSQNKTCQLLLLIIISALSFKIIPAWFIPLRKEWPLLVLASFIIVLFHRKPLFKDKLFIVLSFYSIAVFVKVATGSMLFPNFPVALFEVMLLFVPAFLPLTIILNNNYQFIKKTLFVTFLFLMIETLGSYFVLGMYPGAIRSMYIYMINEGESAGFELYKQGLVDYGLCHGLPILIPPLFYIFKTHKETPIKFFSLIAIVACTSLVWMSESTTALLLLVAMLLLGFMTRLHRSNTSVIVIAILMFPFIVSDTLQLLVLETLGNILGADSSSADKIYELQQSVTKGEQGGDLQGRIERYSLSLNMFFSNPLWGSNGKVGMHSALIDRLGTLGLIGIIPIFLFFKFYFQRMNQWIPKKAKVFYIEAVIAGILMLFAKSMWLWPLFFCFFIIMPFLFIYDFSKVK